MPTRGPAHRLETETKRGPGKTRCRAVAPSMIARTDSLRIVHVAHHPGGAKAFLEPVVDDLNRRGAEAELWVECTPATRSLCQELVIPWKAGSCQITGALGRNLAAFRDLTRLTRLVRPTVLHCHQTRASLWPLLVGRRMRVPLLIYHNHGLSYPAFTGVRRTALMGLQRVLCRLSHEAWFVSHSTLSLARTDGVLPISRGLVPGPGSIAGIDMRSYSLEDFGPGPAVESRQRLGLSDSSCVFGFVGRPMASKGFHLLLDAWKGAGLWRQRANLVCAGCSQDDLSAAGVGSAQRAVGLGYIRDMRAFYQACDVVVLPSRSEGFPYAMLEAAAAGRATLGTRVPGIVDAVVAGKTGILTESDDPVALAQSMERLVADPAERRSLGQAGRNWVQAAFARPVVLEAMWSNYQALLASKGLAPARMPSPGKA